jgi:hypothetical protein
MTIRSVGAQDGIPWSDEIDRFDAPYEIPQGVEQHVFHGREGSLLWVFMRENLTVGGMSESVLSTPIAGRCGDRAGCVGVALGWTTKKPKTYMYSWGSKVSIHPT